MNRMHPWPRAVLKPRMKGPAPLEIVDMVGKLPARNEAGKVLGQGGGEDGWG